MAWAVSSDTTRRGWGCDVSWTRPSGSTTLLTTLGATYSPPLATVLYAPSICSAVTATPWPMGTVAMDVPDHSSGSSMIPPDSPGNRRLVGSASPKSRR